MSKSNPGIALARIVSAALALAAMGCSSETKPEDVVRPVRTMVVAEGAETRMRSFPGRVEASKKAELAFQVSGLLVELPVREGEHVTQGAVLARVRPDEFQARLTALQGQLDQARAALRALQAGERPEQILRLESQVRAAEMRLANARSEYERASRLVASRVVTREEFDRIETAYRVSQEEHTAAVQLLEKGTIGREEDIDAREAEVRGLEGRVVEAQIQLDDATLTAPYDGVIAQRFVEANQNVRAGEPIVKFQDVDELDVVVDVPESVMADVRLSDIVEIEASFPALPGLAFPAHIKEIAQRADPVTQTFAVRVGLKAPPEGNVLPGMTSSVTLVYRRAEVLGALLQVPVAAVAKQPDGAAVVWAIGADQLVSRRPVKLGEPAGALIEIVEGLQPGERIAVAGASRLREGMQVRDLGDALGARP